MEKKNNFKTAMFVVLTLAGLLAAAWLVKQSMETRKGAFYGKAAMFLASGDAASPDGVKICGQESKKVIIKMNPGNQNDPDNPLKITAAELKFSFDKTKVEIDSISFANKYQNSLWNETQANETGILKMTAVSLRKDLPTQNFTLAEVYLRGIAGGSTDFKLVSDAAGDYKIVGTRGDDNPSLDRTIEINNAEGVAIAVKVLDTGDCQPGGALLKFKVAFGGVGSKIPDQKVILKVRKGSFEKIFENINIKFDETGIGSGEARLTGVPFNPNDSRFLFFIKGPKHLSGKFCRDGQTERCDSSETGLTLTDDAVGVAYDWSKLSLEPGDVNQDGKVDTSDFSAVKGQLSQEGNILEDLDFNQIVNGRDIVLLLNTLSTKYEEEI